MRRGFWLISLVGAMGAFRLSAGCASADGSASSPKAACPRGELEPASVCAAWPTAPVATVTTTDGGVTCTWSDVTEPGIDEAIGVGNSGPMLATAPDQIYVAASSPISGSVARIAHLDGTRWTREELPTTATVFSLWGAPGGDVWATTGSSSTVAPSEARCASSVFRRASGAWRTEPPLDLGGAAGAIVTGLDDDHVVAFASSDIGARAFRRCGDGWTELPRRNPRRAGIFTVAGAAPVGNHILAFGGGADPASREILAFLDVLDGTAIDVIDIPVALTDIAAISGSSMDDLYVLALNRNVDGTDRVFHVTEALKTWTPLPVSESLTMRYLSPPMFGTVFGLGCEWPNKYVSPAGDCTRFGALPPSGRFEPGPIDGGGFGIPGSVTADPNQGIHVLAPPGGDAGGIVMEWRHHRANCQTVAKP